MITIQNMLVLKSVNDASKQQCQPNFTESDFMVICLIYVISKYVVGLELKIRCTNL